MNMQPNVGPGAPMLTGIAATHPQIVAEQAHPGIGAQVAPVLRRYAHIVVRRKWLVLSIIAATMLAGLLYTMMKTPQFTATSRLEIARQQKNITNVSGVDAQDAGMDLEFYQTQSGLLQARSLAKRVVAAMRLYQDPDFFGAHDRSFEEAGDGFSAQPKREARSKAAEDLLLNNIDVAQVRGSALFDIRYRSADPTLSARVANAWAEQFIEASIARRFASTSTARAFLEQRLNNLRQKLEQSERDLVNYSARNGIVSLTAAQSPDGKTVTTKTLASTNVEVLNAELAKATADRVLAEVRAVTGGTAEQFATQAGATSGLRQRRAEVQAEYERMLVRFEPAYPQARELKQQIDALDRAINAENSRIRGSFNAQYQEALKRENMLKQRLNAVRDQLSGERRAGIQFGIYQREVDTNRQLHDALLQRYKEIGVAGVSANNISIVDRAEAPDSPSSPNKLLNLLMSTLLGIGLAGLVIFIIEHIDEGVRDPSTVPNDFSVPLLGSVFQISNDNILIDLQDSKSMATEAYVAVRSTLAFSTTHGVPRSFAFTSSRAGEGKSSSAIAIATILARGGKSVVLIDADMRAPRLHERLSLPNRTGLSNFLSGDDNLAELVRKPEQTVFNVITSGPKPPNAAELLDSERLQRLVTELSARFDHVIFDSPPVLGLADAQILGKAVEGVIYVIEAKGVAKRGIRSAIARLRGVGVRLFGVIVTKLDARDADLGYGYGYGYGYGQPAQPQSAARGLASRLNPAKSSR